MFLHSWKLYSHTNMLVKRPLRKLYTKGSENWIFGPGGHGKLQQTFPGSKEVQKIGWEGFSHHPKTARADCHPVSSFPKSLLHFAHNIFGLSTQTIWNLQMSQTGVMLARKSDTHTGNHSKSFSWQQPKKILTRARRQFSGRAGEERGESLGASPSQHQVQWD